MEPRYESDSNIYMAKCLKFYNHNSQDLNNVFIIYILFLLPFVVFKSFYLDILFYKISCLLFSTIHTPELFKNLHILPYFKREKHGFIPI